MKLLEHTLNGDYTLRIWLDETKIVAVDDPRVDDGSVAAGDPDPDWIVCYKWGSEPPRGVSAANYQASQLREGTLLAEDELAARTNTKPRVITPPGQITPA